MLSLDPVLLEALCRKLCIRTGSSSRKAGNTVVHKWNILWGKTWSCWASLYGNTPAFVGTWWRNPWPWNLMQIPSHMCVQILKEYFSCSLSSAGSLSELNLVFISGALLFSLFFCLKYMIWNLHVWTWNESYS